ncbi:endonuclease/exonuclease/phosphatase family protein [Streptomyces sp. DSM 44917]|uniref:Endonuclease/exonuclease/phosphatase family protein n=1 Tax=Streptomyces boetiae TaxID=3075541 RepID=A0ABU2L6V2_9ACTN|nr:endonuclease/exonuclease/phosphatase family protein [Streptomyces sp. DSM 44917]MDT0307293.1 endonuclease/exonuclease/phosphatase family protein [Streptomyces sp. DSM 44917]
MTAGQLSLLTPEPPRYTPSTTTARLMVFNVQHAAPERARRQAAWLAGQEMADLLILTEVGTSPGADALITALGDHGYASVLAPQPADRDYRTVLASRSAELEPLPSGITVLPHRAPCATVRIGDTPFTLLGLYVPSRGPKDRRNENKRAFQQAVTAALPALAARSDGPLIAAGDLNVLEPGHTPHYSVFGPWEYDFYRSFTTAGLTDAFRHLHPDTTEHSWHGRSGNGYRFDHAFLTTPHRTQLLACHYLHQPRQLGLTDHSALLLHVSGAESAP